MSIPLEEDEDNNIESLKLRISPLAHQSSRTLLD